MRVTLTALETEDDQYPILAPDWVLRREAHGSIIYSLSNEECNFVYLSPQAAIILALMDGKTQIPQLIDEIAYVFHVSRYCATKHLEKIIKDLNSNNDIIEFCREPGGSDRSEYDPLEHVIADSQYIAQARLSRPFRLMVCPTGRCQTNCRYCYMDIGNLRTLQELPLNQWRKILDEAAALGIINVDIVGGDVLARSDGAEFIQLLIERGFLFFLSTKCLVTDAIAKAWVETGFKDPVRGKQRQVQISLDSTDAKTVAFLTGRRDQYKRAIASIRALIKHGIYPKVKAVITPYNNRAAFPLVESLLSLGVTHIHFSSYGKSFFRHTDDLELKKEQWDALESDILNLREQYPHLNIELEKSAIGQTNIEPREEVQKKEGKDERVRQWQMLASCAAGRTGLGVAPDGRAFLCEQMAARAPYLFGNLTEQSILDVWNSAELKKICFPSREMFEGTRCFDCELFSTCTQFRGQCFRDNYFDYAGAIYRPTRQCPIRDV